MSQGRHLEILFLLCLTASSAHAQVATGAIMGVTRDETGNVLPGVTVVIANVETGLTRTVVTDGHGAYRAVQLGLGSYEVKAELAGFKTSVRGGIELTVGREAVVNLTLSIGEFKEEVVVLGEAALVDTTSGAVGALVDSKQMRDLPLNARSYDQLARLQPGVVLAKRGTNSTGITGGQTSKMSIGGSRPNTNLFLLDGTDITDYRGGTPGSVAGLALGVEAIREFRVLTNAYSAEFGRSSGAVITTVSRNGTNEFQGSLFEFFRHDRLDAQNFFDRDGKPPFKRNQFGGSLGGPIVRNRTHFFTAYEGLRDRLGLTQRSTVPGAEIRQGILPGGQIIAVADAAKPYLALYPLPNGRSFADGTGEFAFQVAQPTDEDYVTARVDHAFGDRHTAFARYTLSDSNILEPQTVPFLDQRNASRNQYVTLESKQILSSKWINTSRFGFSRTYTTEESLVDGVANSLDWVPGIPLFVASQLDVVGLARLGSRSVPRWFAFNHFELSDDVHLTLGSHGIKTGIILKHAQLNNDGASHNGGTYTFGSVQDFVRGTPESFEAALPGASRHRNWRQTLFGVYLQDDYRVRPRLVLNLGLRYEVATGPHEKNGKVSKLPDPMLNAPIIGNPLFESFKTNFAPRLGMAWDPLGTGKVAVRSGFGVFFDQHYAKYWFSPGRSGGTFAREGTLRREDGAVPFPNGWQLLLERSAQLAPVGESVTTLNYSAVPYTLQYNLLVEAEVAPGTVATIGYSGAQGRNLVRRAEENIAFPQILPDGTKFYPATAPRRNPIWGSVNVQRTDAESNYNGLQVSLRRRYQQGFQFQAAYTWSKAMSIQENIAGGEFVGNNAVLDAYDIGRDWAPAAFDTPHNFVLNSTYDLPFGRDRPGPVGALVGGWQVGGILTLASGSAFGVTSSRGNRNGERGGYQRPDLAPGRSADAVLGGPDQYFDPTAFQAAPPGFYGNVARHTMYDPGFVTLDLSLTKNTKIVGKSNAQFRLEVFNALNRANFDTPNFNVIDSRGRLIGDAGRITRTVTSARQIQLGLRFTF